MFPRAVDMSHIAAICHFSVNMSYHSRYVKSGQNLSLKNEKNVFDKRRPIVLVLTRVLFATAILTIALLSEDSTNS